MSLSPFELGEQLGVGAVGTVWAGVHRASGIPVAIKTLTAPSRAHELSLNRELSAMARLNHHHVLYLYDHGVAGPDEALPEGTAWLALEYAGGGVLDRWRPRTWEAARAAILAVLDGLAHAHARGLVHRDLKPANLLMCADSDLRPGLKIADFGLAWATDRDRRGIRRGGTPAYISPEQVRGSVFELGPWTDLYALGGIMWEWLTGCPPFGWVSVEENLDAHQHREPPEFTPRIPVPDGVEALIRHLLAKPVADRPASAAWVSSRLLALGDPTLTPRGPALDPITQSSLPTVIGASKPVVARPTAPTVERLPLPSSWHAHEPARSSLIAGAGRGLFRLRELRIVGRVREKTALWSALRRVVREERPEVLALTGPQGMGATGLARWLMQRVREIGVAEGHHAEPTNGLSGLVDRAFGLVSVVGGVDIPNTLTAPERTLVEERQQPLARHVFDWLVERAKRGPVVVVVDDPGESAELMELLSAAMFWEGSARILFIATGRSDADSWEDLSYMGRFKKLELAPLDPTSMVDLAQGDLGLAQSLSVPMVAECGGNPGVLVSWVQSLADRGLLEPVAGGFGLREGAARVPPVDGDLEARVDAVLAELDPHNRVSVQLGAVLGLSVDLIEWDASLAMLGSERRESALRPFVRAGLVSRDSVSWRFVDPRTRFVLLDRLDDRERSGLNIAAAMGLAGLDITPQRQARRGLYLLDGGQEQRGRRLLFEALALLREVRDWRMVLRVTERLKRGVDLDSADLDLQFAVRYYNMAARSILDSSAEAHADGVATLALADHLDADRAEQVLALVAEVFVLGKDFEGGAAVLARTTSRNPVVLRVRGMLAMRRGEAMEAERWFREVYDGSDNDHLRSTAANGLGMLMGAQGRLDDAALWFTRCAERVEEAQTFAPLANLALVYIQGRRFERAVVAVRRALVTAEVAQGVRVRASLMFMATLAAIGAGDQALFRHCRSRALFFLHRYGIDYTDVIERCIEILEPVADADGRSFLDAVSQRIESASR